MSESSIVALAISVVGILTTYLTVKTTLRADVERATVLRFVEMFETTIQGLSSSADVNAKALSMCATKPTIHNLSSRLLFLTELSKTFSEVAKTADLSMLRLGIYFPDVEHETFDARASSRAEMALCEWKNATDCRMKTEDRALITDAELIEYCTLERNLVKAFEGSKEFIESRREYFIRCYAEWRRKNLSYIRDICPSADSQ